MSLTEWKLKYLEYCKVQRNLAVLTLKAYGRDIDAFIDFLKQQHNNTSVEFVTDTIVSQFLVEQYSQNISPKSLARYRSSLNNLFAFILHNKGISNNPIELVNTPKIGSKLPEVLDVDTVSRLLNIPAESEIAIRDKAIIELFYSSGLRLSELSNLYWFNLDFEQALVTVTGKGNKQRLVPVGRHALQALDKWKSIGKLWDVGETGFVFISKRGGQFKQRSIQARIKFWAQRQGLWERVYPHLLRHSFASHVLESSGNLRAVQEMLGHADISTTQIYTHLNFQHLAKVYDKAHPRARKK
ncbi:MAG: tyrosine recombinase XerC [Proteobacteria bacterium]|nr:tyrosine recombinase XerC [Pseudomonadota bacterium]